MADAFQELLKAADHKAKRIDPHSTFCLASQHGFYDESPWTFTFRVPGGNGKGDRTLNLFYAAGEFTIDGLDAATAGVHDIELPLALNLTEAEDILRDAGIHGVITHIELSWPKVLEVDQPYYTFEVDDDLWFIGVNDGTLHRAPLSNAVAAGV